MTTSLKTSMVFDLAATFSEALDLQTRQAPAAFKRTFGWTDGAAVDKANLIWTDRRTLAASTTEDLDLTGGLTDAFGSAITFARIKALIIAASSGNANNVHVGGDAAGLVGWVANNSDIVVVRPGGLLVWIAPDATAAAVTATTADVLQIANSAGSTSVTYDIALIGAAT
jgi:hypothetical protein